MSQGSIADLQQLAQLSGLNNLDLSYNRVNDVTQIEKLFQGCTNLRVLNLKENPVCKGKEYRKEVIAVSCEGLGCYILGEKLTTTQRNWMARQCCHKSVPS